METETLPIVAATAINTSTAARPRRASTPLVNSSRRTSQHSIFAKNVLMSKITLPVLENARLALNNGEVAAPRPTSSAQPSHSHASGTASALAPTPPRSTPQAKDLAPPPPTSQQHNNNASALKPLPAVGGHHGHGPAIAKDGVGAALTDTPAPSTPGSPRMYVTHSP